MAKEKGKQVVSGAKSSPPNEFSRGDEKAFHGGDMTISSPVGSIFDAVSVSSTNAMESALSEQGGKRGGKGKK